MPQRIAKVYESESYDYPVQIQESVSEISSSVAYNLTSFAANNLKGTNLPAPAAPGAPPVHQHKTLPHALSRAATSAAGAIVTPAEGTTAGESGDKLGKALALYASSWERIAVARLEQDDNIITNFLAPWQQTLNTSISLALKARQAVKVSRLELDAAKQSCVAPLRLDREEPC
jgi:Bin/amphiphysin/Rvs domain for vesicular trafficking